MGNKKIVILAYHGFTDVDVHEGIENHQGKHLRADIFESHIGYLKKKHVITPLEKVVDWYSGKGDIPDSSVVITIDDGYRSNYLIAYPILKRYDAPASIFLSTGFLDGKSFLWVDRLEYAISRTDRDSLKLGIFDRPFSLGTREKKVACESSVRRRLKSMAHGAREDILAELERSLGQKLADAGKASDIYRPLLWDEVLDMSKSGLISIGSHGHTHTVLTRLSAGEVREEFAMSGSLIERCLGLPCRSFSYPNGGIGDFDYNTSQALIESGYSSGLINVPGFNCKGSDVFQLKRFCLSRRSDISELKSTVSGMLGIARHLKSRILIAKSGIACGRPVRPASQEKSVADEFGQEAKSYSDKYLGQSPGAHSFRIRQRRVREILDKLPGGRMLDVGCGPGIMAGYALSRGFEFYGVDISPEMIDMCRVRFNYAKDARFFVGKVEELKFHDSFFDVVICMGVMEYVDDDNAALKEIARVLRRGGIAVITLPNRQSPYRIWHSVVSNKLLIDAVKKLLGRHDATLIHREFTKNSCAGLFASCGLRMEDAVYYNFSLFPFPFDRIFSRLAARTSERLEFLGRSRLRWLGTGFVVTAKKV